MLHLQLPAIKLVQMAKFSCENFYGTKVYLWFDKILQESAESTTNLVQNKKFHDNFTRKKVTNIFIRLLFQNQS